MKKSFLKKVSIVLTSAVMLLGTACNNKIKVSYDYNVDDYVELGQYENITVDVDKTSIENKLIENKIKQDVEDNTTYTEVDRGAVETDQILVTYTASTSGVATSGFTNTDGVTMILGTDKLGLNLDELDEALYGMKPGETKVMVVDIPEDYSNSIYAGTKVVFELTMKTVSQANVPMITNAYVKEAFGFDTVEEYRESVKEELKTKIDSQVEDEMQGKILSALQDTSKVSEYPDSLLEELNDRYNESIGFYADFTNMSKDEYCQSQYGLTFDEYVKKSAAQQLIMEAIVKKLNITIRDYDYKGDLSDFASDNGYSDASKFEEKYGKDKIVKAMLIQKAQDYVIDHANVTYN